MPRALAAGQRCEVWIASLTTGARELILTSAVLLEAPNWAADNSALFLNGAGGLWRLDMSSRSLGQVPLTGIPELNNDHVLAPGCNHIYLSADDGHIYRAAIQGGEAVRVTEHDGSSHFLHGVSPDGRELAYVGVAAGDFAKPGLLITMPAGGGPGTTIDTGPGHCDGPEYAPEGEWIYLNTESFGDWPGHAQIARVRSDGSGLERLTRSGTADWFPHISPDGLHAAYLRFPAGTVGHPADLPVEVVTVSTADWNTALHTWTLRGGQGTLNVNSWSPDSTRFAYVAYPLG
ncbi:biopolymer transporter Tol [Pseudarthrobacter sp. PH31-O2]|uniref:TolB family protein n=1 Tax=Pseudarthrobacter sp. PH31-O2 TaxID=3046206 RepID=UPI0024B9F606|nr:biopolymer transporter Tol [Pseudarthrobacter sp. PH31-O2]MDJ0353016.1 biopolymer transporter Tol [Pseudarthrobacter sp. PH31-O2]